jgi:hypothetical protein
MFLCSIIKLDIFLLIMRKFDSTRYGCLRVPTESWMAYLEPNILFLLLLNNTFIICVYCCVMQFVSHSRE